MTSPKTSEIVFLIGDNGKINITPFIDIDQTIEQILDDIFKKAKDKDSSINRNDLLAFLKINESLIPLIVDDSKSLNPWNLEITMLKSEDELVVNKIKIHDVIDSIPIIGIAVFKKDDTIPLPVFTNMSLFEENMPDTTKSTPKEIDALKAHLPYIASNADLALPEYEYTVDSKMETYFQINNSINSSTVIPSSSVTSSSSSTPTVPLAVVTTPFSNSIDTTNCVILNRSSDIEEFKLQDCIEATPIKTISHEDESDSSSTTSFYESFSDDSLD